MSEIEKRKKALSVNPLKVSQPLGASMAFLGLNRCMPLFHGSQGCTAFAKVMLVRHFREPIPLQTTAMEQVSTVMGGDDNIIEALDTICKKSHPDVIGLLTTGLTETQGSDINNALKQFRDKHPEHSGTAVVPVNTPDFSGSLETGFAIAVEGIIKTLVPLREEAGSVPGRRLRQVNVLPGSAMTSGDVEALRELLETFELRPLFIPDISDSLGYLPENDFNPLTVGGTPVSEVALAGDSIATIAIGPSMVKAGELLQTRTGVPLYKFDSLLGLEAMDEFVHAISKLAERPVPLRIERHRAQLQDAMLDAHFMLGFARIGLAAEPDELLAMSRLLAGVGAEVVSAVTSTRGPALKESGIETIKIGDLEDLEQRAKERDAQLIIGNSHCVATAERLKLPMLHYGLPQYDLVGGFARTWIGYRGSRQALFDLANLMLKHHAGHEIKPYHSTLSPKRDAVA